MQQQSEARLKLFERLLETCEHEYEDKVETFKQLDDKGQSNATIAGILIAACIAFVQEETVKRIVAARGMTGPILLAITIILAVFSIICSLLCMKVSKVESPPDVEEVGDWVTNLVDLDEAELTTRRLENFVRDQSLVWQRAIKDHSRINITKANWLFSAQLVLLAAFVCITFVVLVFLGSFF